ncbi:Tn3 family transposase [Nonomuraea sp. NPDC050310]|uniref:Tn3 family transposase n=1 Tax=Nonomuraea sp. NPDC050310 TaxID=3154935 RepID=UPI0033F36C7A
MTIVSMSRSPHWPFTWTTAIVYLNTRTVQIVLAEPKWRKSAPTPTRRALSALFWSHLNLYGGFERDMSKQLDLGPGRSTEGHRSDDPL